MRILILTNYANGLFLFRRELLEAFLADGHEVIVSVPPDENVAKLEKIGVKIAETNFNRHGMNPAKDFALMLAYKKLIKELKPGFVLTYTIKPNLYGGMAAKLTHTPYICNITGLGMAIENGGIMSKALIAFYKTATSGARKVFFQNERNKKFMQDRGVARKNAGLLPGSGVNLAEHPFREYPSEAEGIHFLAVIRIMKDKGISEYLEAARTITSEYENVHFDLVGEYEEDEWGNYESLIKEMEEKGIITYHGHLDTVEPIMSKSHVVIHPSYHEGMSNVLLEAAACGRPILCSDINGCIEAIEPEKSGFTFEIKSAESLEAAIRKMLSLSEEDRAKMGKLGREYIEKHFDRQLVIDAYKNVLEAAR
ncbi:glycosyltransferase family 4 protein [Butyrivibrio sp. WCD3002]|uniref:glycosyltransferase family 4 protein n=1 Tax=Butyrivibrio sp. WCD3002 TaxID=1280676 RepID=UPI00047D83D0|nr:glycosyltransferase family 4 protein [Butyrivibrio sp. WCD3002]